MTEPNRTPTKRRFSVVSLKEERLERKLVLAFGFMSFIPILIVFWVKVYGVDLTLAIYAIALSAFVGYFLVARRMVGAVVTLTKQVEALTSGKSVHPVEVKEGSEIGELAKAFNRITSQLEQKIEELESSRQLVKRLLARIGTAIISNESIDTLLDLIVENTVSALEAQKGSLLLVDGERRELFVKTTWSADDQAANREQRIKLGEGIVGWVAKEGQPLRATGLPSSVGFIHHGRSGEGAVLSVPLSLRDRPIGVMTVMRDEATRVFTEDDEVLMTSIGMQVAVAIENYRLNLDIERTYVETIMALAMAVEAKDPYSAGHSKRVAYYAMQIGKAMGLDEETLRVLDAAGVLHDIGKIGIKDVILLKPGALSTEEEEIMRQHAIIGHAIVKPVRSLQRAAELVRHHHERYDGSGYPSGLKGDAIPLGARIMTVADTYDAMTTDRPYRKRLPIANAKLELRQKAGIHFDPAVVEAFLRVLDEKDQRQTVRQPTPV